MINIVVWEEYNYVLLGVQLRKDFADELEKRLRPDDPARIEWAKSAPLFEEIFAGYETNLISVKTLEELDAVIANCDYLVVHKQRLTSEVLRKGKKIKLLQHMGQDYRGIPMDTAREMGIPVCATPLINYIAVAEHAWMLLLNHYKQMDE